VGYCLCTDDQELICIGYPALAVSHPDDREHSRMVGYTVQEDILPGAGYRVEYNKSRKVI